MGEGEHCRMFVPITETVKGWPRASLCVDGQGMVRVGNGQQVKEMDELL